MSTPRRIRVGSWIATPELNLLQHGERALRIEPRTMDVLTCLASRPGEVVSVEDLHRNVWQGVVVTDASIYMAIKQLRRAFAGAGEGSQYVETIPKRGYRLTAAVLPMDDVEARLVETSPAVAPAEFVGPRAASASRHRGIGPRVRIAGLVGGMAALVAGVAWYIGASGVGTAVNKAVPGGADTPANALTVRVPITIPGLTNFAISHDSRRIAWTAGPRPDQLTLFIRALDTIEPREIPEVAGALGPIFWSHDNLQIGFSTMGDYESGFLLPATIYRLARIPIDGGPPQTLLSGQTVLSGGGWSPEDVILFDGGTGIERISAASGGSRSAVTELLPNEGAHEMPTFLPDGRHFLFTASFREPGVYVQSIDSSERTKILPQSATARYAGGFLVYNRGRALMAQRFDPDRLLLQGEPVQIADGLRVGVMDVWAAFSVTDDVLAYATGEAWTHSPSPSQLSWYDRHGRRLETIGEAGPYRGVALAHGGKQIAVHKEELSGGDVWIVDLERSRNTFMRLTRDSGHAAQPVWSSGDDLVIYSGRNFDLYVQAASGLDAERPLVDSLRFALASDASSDGAVFVTHTQLESNDADISVVFPDGDLPPQLLEGSRSNEMGARRSPNGQLLAYVSDQSGRNEVYVRSYPDRTFKRMVSSAGGEGPLWSSDGTELYYYTRAGAIMMVPVADAQSAGLSFGPAIELFRADLMLDHHYSEFGILPHMPYGIAADGRFLVNERAPSGGTRFNPPSGELIVVFNWAAEIRQHGSIIR